MAPKRTKYRKGWYTRTIPQTIKGNYIRETTKGEGRSNLCLARESFITFAECKTRDNFTWIIENKNLISLRMKWNLHGPPLEVDIQTMTLEESLSITSFKL